jgi:hypothetical protein
MMVAYKCMVKITTAAAAAAAAVAAVVYVQVKDAMLGKDKVVTVKPNSLMSDAAQLMLHNDVSSRRLGTTGLGWGSQARPKTNRVYMGSTKDRSCQRSCGATAVHGCFGGSRQHDA